MGLPHLIDSVEVELEFASERLVKENQARLDEFFGTRLKTVASEVFDQLSPEGATVILDRLEIDLGEFSSSTFETELDDRLRRALTQALGERMTEVQTGATNDRLVDGVSQRLDSRESPTEFGHSPAVKASPSERTRLSLIEEMRSGDSGGASRSDDTSFTFDNRVPGPDSTEEIVIANAGQVLLAPWLPRLFDAAGLLSDGAFADREAAEKTVHLLQYAVDGEIGTPESRLALNKVLCGVPQDVPLQRPEDIDDSASILVEQLLGSLCANWPGLEGTSTGGLQTSFLQREGRLRLVDDTWQLLVSL